MFNGYLKINFKYIAMLSIAIFPPIYGAPLGSFIIFLGVKNFKSIHGRKENLIMLIIALEIILLGIGIIFVHTSFFFDDLIGATFALFLLPLAGAESAIALAIFIAYYPNRNTMMIF
jgi:NADH-ubiquinone oxidoreductase chain 4L